MVATVEELAAARLAIDSAAAASRRAGAEVAADIRLVTEAALPYGRPVAVCGEAAADPLAAALFVGLGVDELSVAPGSLARQRAGLTGLDVDASREAAGRAIAATSAAEVKEIASELVEPAMATAGSPAA